MTREDGCGAGAGPRCRGGCCRARVCGIGAAWAVLHIRSGSVGGGLAESCGNASALNAVEILPCAEGPALHMGARPLKTDILEEPRNHAENPEPARAGGALQCAAPAHGPGRTGIAERERGGGTAPPHGPGRTRPARQRRGGVTGRRRRRRRGRRRSPGLRRGPAPARPAAVLRRSARAVLARPRHGEPVLLAEARQTGADGPLQALQFGVGRRQGHNERAPFAGELDDAGRLTPTRDKASPGCKVRLGGCVGPRARDEAAAAGATRAPSIPGPRARDEAAGGGVPVAAGPFLLDCSESSAGCALSAGLA